MFPDINYFVVMDNVTTKEPIRVLNKMVKSHLGDKLIEFVQKAHKLPYACKIIKYFKNGNIQVDYKPTKWDRFAIDISIKKWCYFLRHQGSSIEQFFELYTVSTLDRSISGFSVNTSCQTWQMAGLAFSDISKDLAVTATAASIRPNWA